MLLRQYIDINFNGNVAEFTRIAFPNSDIKPQQIHTWLKYDIEIFDGKICTVRRILAEGMPPEGLGKQSDLRSKVIDSMIAHIEKKVSKMELKEAQTIIREIKKNITFVYGTD
jgi:hypothetical protein